MRDNETVCGQRITYENAAPDHLNESETALYESRSRRIENCVAIIAEFQKERTNADGDITEPLTRQQIGSILELGPDLDRSIAMLAELRGRR